MKAKIEKTGEIVEVNPILINKVLVFETPDMHIYGAEELEFEKNPFKDYVDWEQRRFELVKAMLPQFTSLVTASITNEVLLCSVKYEGSKTATEIAAESAIEYADVVIAKLKEE